MAITLGELLLNDPLFDYVRLTAAEEREAWELAKRYSDKGFSFVDCMSFVVMGRRKLREAFAFDDHFRQYGRFLVRP